MREEGNEKRSAVTVLDGQFGELIESLHQLAQTTPSELLYKRPPHTTVGENILRSAGCLEQVVGGLTANLWDDPFEWTLPEQLSTTELVHGYLSDVSASCDDFFAHLQDEALVKLVSAPSGEEKTVIGLLLESLVVAGDYRGRAVVTLKSLRQ